MAEQQMEMAERLFYSGRYAEAIQIFDRVLQLEPNWERARGHRTEAENYLRTGYIPAVALPADAASALSLLIAFVIVIVNFAVDVIYGIVDPRIRVGREGE